MRPYMPQHTGTLKIFLFIILLTSVYLMKKTLTKADEVTGGDVVSAVLLHCCRLGRIQINGKLQLDLCFKGNDRLARDPYQGGTSFGNFHIHPHAPVTFDRLSLSDGK